MYKINDRALPVASLKSFHSCSEYLPYIQNVRYHRVTSILESLLGAACEKQKKSNDQIFLCMKNGHLFTYLRLKNNVTNHTMLYMGNHKIELTDLTNFEDSNVTTQIRRSFPLIRRKGEVYTSLKSL